MNTLKRSFIKALAIVLIFIIMGLIGRNDYNDKMDEIGHPELKVQ